MPAMAISETIIVRQTTKFLAKYDMALAIQIQYLVHVSIHSHSKSSDSSTIFSQPQLLLPSPHKLTITAYLFLKHAVCTRSTMGCANSKRLEATVAAGVYHPPPTSIALFDITKIDEPWLLTALPIDDPIDEKPPKPTPVPLSLLDKLDSFEFAPKSWSEVSKALEDLKPSLHRTPVQAAAKKNHSDSPPRPPPPELAGFRSVKENSFVLRDRLEREGKKDAEELRRWKNRDPLEGYPERWPPGNPDGVVLYTTTLRGVRRTFKDCERLRQVVEGHAVEAGLEFEERDVSLHGEYLKEVREMVGGEAAVPRLFLAGRYLGGVEEVVELAEAGKLGEMMRWMERRIGGEKRKGGRRDCEGCGGARFVPCMECNGRCKVVAEDGKGVVRCGLCNENGLALCPMCH